MLLVGLCVRSQLAQPSAGLSLRKVEGPDCNGGQSGPSAGVPPTRWTDEASSQRPNFDGTRSEPKDLKTAASVRLFQRIAKKICLPRRRAFNHRWARTRKGFFGKVAGISGGGHMRIRSFYWSQADEKTFKKWKLGMLIFYLCISGLIAASIVTASLITSVPQYAAK
jgi:hypothetical protein